MSTETTLATILASGCAFSVYQRAIDSSIFDNAIDSVRGINQTDATLDSLRAVVVVVESHGDAVYGCVRVALDEPLIIIG